MAPTSYVYAIRAMPDGPVKLGHTVNIEARLRQLQTGAHDELNVIWSHYGDVNTERRLHMIFAFMHKRGEWHDFGDMTDERISLLCNRAAEYRGSLADIPQDSELGRFLTILDMRSPKTDESGGRDAMGAP